MNTIIFANYRDFLGEVNNLMLNTPTGQVAATPAGSGTWTLYDKTGTGVLGTGNLTIVPGQQSQWYFTVPYTVFTGQVPAVGNNIPSYGFLAVTYTENGSHGGFGSVIEFQQPGMTAT